MKSTYSRAVSGLALVSMLAALYMIFLYAPTERTMGDVQRIFYFHISAWWVSALALLVAFIGSAGYLWKRDRRFDAPSLASTEIGVLFMTIGISPKTFFSG